MATHSGKSFEEVLKEMMNQISENFEEISSSSDLTEAPSVQITELKQPVIKNLQLEQKKTNPSFSELLFLLRTEEDRQQSKESRMKKHISSSKQRVNLSSQSTCACGVTSEPHFSAVAIAISQKTSEQASELIGIPYFSEKSTMEIKD